MEMVSFWICIKVILFTFFFMLIDLQSLEGATAKEEFATDTDGLEVMRSMSIVPMRSWLDAMARGCQRES